MKKVFLYLYPIKEYVSMFLFHDDKLYDEEGIERPLPIINDTIDKRYRKKGYQIIYVLYPDRNLFGIEPRSGDRIIYSDINFSDSSVYDDKGREKIDFVPKYTDESLLLERIGQVDELRVGGFHASDCVERAAELALKRGIDTLVDLDLTELFFAIYRQKDYFDRETYSPERYKSKFLDIYAGEEGYESMEREFYDSYSSPVYGFPKKQEKQL